MYSAVMKSLMKLGVADIPNDSRQGCLLSMYKTITILLLQLYY
jgi:hypothetical protein